MKYMTKTGFFRELNLNVTLQKGIGHSSQLVFNKNGET